ncbi:hypothetical protein J6590_076929 [Homalodisca vitripennis]|nr:hypothetical protein J6590_076929 [Homalodisca vitripennis]
MSAPLHRIDSPLTLPEILEALEDTASEYTAADIYICSPDNDDPHNITDEESGEEDFNDPNRVCHRQLQAEAEIRFKGIENDEDTPGDQRGDLSDVRVEDRGQLQGMQTPGQYFVSIVICLRVAE